MIPNDLPPWEAVYQQTQRWLNAGVFEAIVCDLRVVLRLAEGREGHPSAAIFDRRTLQSTPESSPREGYEGAKRLRGSKVHIAVDTLGHLMALHVTAANEQDRAQVAQLAAQVQEVTGDAVDVAFVDQGYTGVQPAQDAVAHGMHLEVVKLPEAKKGFVLLPHCWVVERSFACVWRASAPSTGLRTTARHTLGFSLSGFRYSVVQALHRDDTSKYITYFSNWQSKSIQS